MSYFSKSLEEQHGSVGCQGETDFQRKQRSHQIPHNGSGNSYKRLEESKSDLDFLSAVLSDYFDLDNSRENNQRRDTVANNNSGNKFSDADLLYQDMPVGLQEESQMFLEDAFDEQSIGNVTKPLPEQEMHVLRFMENQNTREIDKNHAGYDLFGLASKSHCQMSAYSNHLPRKTPSMDSDLSGSCVQRLKESRADYADTSINRKKRIVETESVDRLSLLRKSCKFPRSQSINGKSCNLSGESFVFPNSRQPCNIPDMFSLHRYGYYDEKNTFEEAKLDAISQMPVDSLFVQQDADRSSCISALSDTSISCSSPYTYCYDIPGLCDINSRCIIEAPAQVNEETKISSFKDDEADIFCGYKTAGTTPAQCDTNNKYEEPLIDCTHLYSGIDPCIPELPLERDSTVEEKSIEMRKKLKRGCRLWEFIRNLLLDNSTNPSLIRWENRKEGTFRIVKSKAIAHIWGMKKGNGEMNYEKLSRAMRYYYKKQIFCSVIGQRLVYKFGPRATGWKDSDDL